MEPHSAGARLMRKAVYQAQFRLSRRKAQIFSLKIPHLTRTPVNTDNIHFSVSQVAYTLITSTPLYRGLRTVQPCSQGPFLFLSFSSPRLSLRGTRRMQTVHFPRRNHALMSLNPSFFVFVSSSFYST